MDIRLAENREEISYAFTKMAEVGVWSKYLDYNLPVVVLVIDGKIVGFCREVGFLGLSVIGSVWIDEDFRGKKLGIQMIEFLLKNINSREIWLDCKESLIPYYSKLGFSETKNFPEGFLDEDEITYLKAMVYKK